MPYHMQPTPTPRRFGPPAALNAAISSCALRQCGRSASRHWARPAEWASVWPVAVVSPTRSALRRRNSSRSMPSCVGQLVHHRLVGDGGLRHAEAAEGAGRRGVGEPGIAPGAHVGHAVGTHGVHRHAVGDGRPPRGIGAGVEVRRHLAGEQPALGIAAEPGGDARGMALGRGRHALRPRVDQGDRPAELPRRHRHQRLDREVELAAEAAAAGRRHDAHRLGPQPHDDRHLVAVHVGRLGRDMDLDAIAHALGPAGLGLDIGVLDEGGLEHALGHRGAGREGFVRLAALHAALQQQIARLVGLHQRRIGCHRGIEADNRRLRRPGDRHVVVADRQHDVALADQGDDGLAAIAHLAVGQHRLVLDVGIDAETVRRHVGRRQHRGEPPAQRHRDRPA